MAETSWVRLGAVCPQLFRNRVLTTQNNVIPTSTWTHPASPFADVRKSRPILAEPSLDTGSLSPFGSMLTKIVNQQRELDKWQTLEIGGASHIMDPAGLSRQHGMWNLWHRWTILAVIRMVWFPSWIFSRSLEESPAKPKRWLLSLRVPHTDPMGPCLARLQLVQGVANQTPWMQAPWSNPQ